ncbi:MAG: methylenetetrahydrofolate reductase [NAD(P)H] [Candidatus Tectomicrobia bacterium]|uniref:Methylenetetrahydrofolate reductase n=1 Tax=Tectimicrobiota bacterium TaxID=2528274 RepID=A0A932GS53_UNCTE|nr:methylenetetrahydrofolate reductase [NAD(P)H] [Candidatus Tectomicrobia bacterium]
MKFSEAYGRGKFGLSFEIFPPKTPAGEDVLFGAVKALVAFRPSFITCTYGAGGSTREKTIELTVAIGKRFGVSTAAHLTCVGSSHEDLRAWLGKAASQGIENIVALRGDPPRGESHFTPVDGGPAHANELVTVIRREFPHFGIAVAGYPETHQEAASPEEDLAHLKRKVEAGADVVITQLFYENRDFFAFRRRYGEAGIQVPLVPGILPIISYAQIRRITALCGAKLPPALVAKLEAKRDDPEAEMEVGIAHAIRQCRELLDAGAPGLHFYVLNKAAAPSRIIEALGLPGR